MHLSSLFSYFCYVFDGAIGKTHHNERVETYIYMHIQLLLMLHLGLHTVSPAAKSGRVVVL